MSDHGEVEVESPAAFQVLPKDVLAEQGSVKLFNKWSYEDVEIRDISLTYALSPFFFLFFFLFFFFSKNEFEVFVVYSQQTVESNENKTVKKHC